MPSHASSRHPILARVQPPEIPFKFGTALAENVDQCARQFQYFQQFRDRSDLVALLMYHDLAQTWGGESPGKTGLAWIVDICSIGDRIFVAAWRRACVEHN